ncbi:efflux RND transporter permease subunit [Opitutia bacterium ISCC 51]|nr:efflux RND transporter permease subunit [Opitutae bacterium ISCC 51]QXD28485.1 efflux RND transporter permease subunit [Opitutae bacterium ISCC 52]
MIRWFTKNGIAANFLMVGILLAGLYTAFFKIPLEVSPALSWDLVMMDMRYRGGTPKDIEKAILIPVEAALESVQGIKELNADGSNGRARFYLRAKDGVDLRALMDDVKAQVDTINTFPRETEPPRIFIPESANSREVLTVAVSGDLSDHDLLKAARQVRDDLLEIPGISRTNIQGDRNREISIEADEKLLRSYNLTFQNIADAIRRNSIDMPAGSIRTESGRLNVRTKGQAYSEEDFSKIPIRSANGADVLIGEVATVIDTFEGGTKFVEFNEKPALYVEVMRVGQESAIDISDKVHDYVENAHDRFPDGVNLHIWKDESDSIRGRLDTLVTSLFQGSILVMIILGIFLRPQVAFWVVLGIPVSFAGGALLMPVFGISANIMSLFGYILVLGVVVDDAIITGENVYTQLKTGMDPTEASILGTKQVAVPVTFGVITTIVAFLPLLYFDGVWGDFAKQIPPIVGAVLIFSLVESKLILPAHLKHVRVGRHPNFFTRFQGSIANNLERFVEKVYRPSLKFATSNRFSVLALFTTMGLLMAGYCIGGRLGFQSFPSVDTARLTATLAFPGDVPVEITDRYIRRIVGAVDQLKEEFLDPGTGEPLVRNVSLVSGAKYPGKGYSQSQGFVQVEVIPPEGRSEPGPRNSVIANRWAEIIGPIPGARQFRVYSESSFKQGGENNEEYLNLELRGPSSEGKAEVAKKIRDLLMDYEGISTAWADINFRAEELVVSLKPRAIELGLTQQLLARQIRQAFYGEQAQRVLEDVDDIRVMVRLPDDERESLYTFERIKIRAPRGADVPLTTVAEINFAQAPTFVERNDRAEIIRIGAQPMDETVDIIGISKELTPQIQEFCNEVEGISYQWKGYVAEAEESKRRTIIGSLALIFILYALLAIPFKSMVQPFFVLIALPFGVIGALLGHMIMGLTPSYLSIFGMLALAGVVVNDSLVMVDFVNQRTREGIPLLEACLEAGGKRFRPIMLTSITTFVGLLPLMLETSLHAQFLIPMAVSLGFGVVFATVITLYLIPCSLLVAEDCGTVLSHMKQWYFRPFRNRGEEASQVA